MAKDSARHAVLSDTASRDKKSADFELATTLPEGMAFPFDFGFIASTLADEGDPVDVLVLMDSPAMAGCSLRCRLIGVVEAREKERGKRWEQNDRLIAVARHARTHDGIGINRLSQLRPHTLDDIEAFFTDYNKLHKSAYRR